MKLRVYSDYEHPLGTVEVQNGKIVVHAEPPETDHNLKLLTMSFAEHLAERAMDGKTPDPVAVLREMARRMPPGNRSWCDVLA